MGVEVHPWVDLEVEQALQVQVGLEVPQVDLRVGQGVLVVAPVERVEPRVVDYCYCLVM